jgi:phenylpropionate dioxygenase-like ring-hydroxylating dioxygenase large terminal subunit
MTLLNGHDKGPPPGFEEARNLRQQVRAAGLDPNYWYPAEWSAKLRRGQVCEVVFWGQSIALYRTTSGSVHALANRCAHRQLKLSKGEVSKECLVCPYHGWTYDGTGQVVEIPHDLFGHRMPRYQVPCYPVRERYGLIWIFPGDAALAEQCAMPEIPELEGSDPWPWISVDFTWKAHHSMVIDNVSDFTHAHLHRRYQPFSGAELVDYRTEGDAVSLKYVTKVGRGRFSGLFVDHDRVNTNQMDLCYEYPYQWSNTDDEIKHWLFVRPIDARTTRSFFIFYFKALKVPLMPVPLRGFALQRILDISKVVMIRPLLSEDGVAVEGEQEGYEAHWDAPPAEMNPVVREFQRLTVRKWREHLAPATREEQPQPAAVHA